MTTNDEPTITVWYDETSAERAWIVSLEDGSSHTIEAFPRSRARAIAAGKRHAKRRGLTLVIEEKPVLVR